MKRFVFELESVLKQRTIIENIRKAEFGKRMAELNHAKARLAAVRDSIEANSEEFRSSLEREVDSSVLMAFSDYAAKLMDDEVVAMNEVAAAESELETARAVLTAATQEKKAMERLKEKRRKEHVVEMLRAEQLEIDEIAARGVHRKAGAR